MNGEQPYHTPEIARKIEPAVSLWVLTGSSSTAAEIFSICVFETHGLKSGHPEINSRSKTSSA